MSYFSSEQGGGGPGTPQNLADTLAIGNSTGGIAISSPDTLNQLNVTDVGSSLSAGLGATYLTLDPNDTATLYAPKVDINASTRTYVSTPDFEVRGSGTYDDPTFYVIDSLQRMFYTVNGYTKFLIDNIADQFGLGDLDNESTGTNFSVYPIHNKALFTNADTKALFGINIDPTYSLDVAGSTTVAPAEYTSSGGTGLDDMTSSGTYTGTSDSVYVITIVSTGSPDKINITKNGIAFSTGIDIITGPQLIADGVYYDFASDTGHTNGNYWTISATANGIINTTSGYYINGREFANQDYNNSITSIGANSLSSKSDNTNSIVSVGSDSLVNVSDSSGIVSIGGANGNNIVHQSNVVLIGDRAELNSASPTGHAIAIGHHSITADNTFVAGSPDSIIKDVYFADGIETKNPTTLNIHGTNTSNADHVGGIIQIDGGMSRGDKNGGSVIIQTSPAGASGSSQNALQASVEYDANGNIRASRLHDNATAQGSASEQDIRSGTYRPTVGLLASGNIVGATTTMANWKRVGNIVTVSGEFEVKPTTTLTATFFDLTLPVPSNFTQNYNLSGTAVSGATFTNMSAVVYADVTNDKAKVQFISTDVTNNNTWSYFYQYEVL